MRLLSISASIGFSILVGCAGDRGGGGGGGGPPPMFGPGVIMAESSETVRPLAGMSAPAVFTGALAPLLIAQLSTDPDLMGDPTCPRVTRTATQTIYEGGCTAMNGTRWLGRATAPADMTGGMSLDASGEVVYDAFGLDSETECPTRPGERFAATWDGRVTLTRAGDTATFDVMVELHGSGVSEECLDVVFTGITDYEGTVREQGTPDAERQTWNGAGMVAYDIDGEVPAGLAVIGAYQLETADEILDDAICADEAASGTTTVRGGTDTMVITYDGATDCDPEHTVQWSFNGAPRGELMDVQCSAAPGAAGSWLSPLVLALASATLLRRRR